MKTIHLKMPGSPFLENLRSAMRANFKALPFFMTIGAWCLILPAETASAALNECANVECAYFRPDKDPVECVWKEGWTYKVKDYSVQTKRSGSFHIYLRNLEANELKIAKILLNEKSLLELQGDFQVIWHRVLPNPIPGNGIAEIIVRLRHPTDKIKNLFVMEFENGRKLQCEVNSENGPKMEIGFVGFSPKKESMYIYIDGEKSVSRVFMDEKEITSSIQSYDCGPNLTLLRLSLQTMLYSGSYHVLRILANNGEQTASRVRVWECDFPVGVFGCVRDVDLDAYLKMHFNAVININFAPGDKLMAKLSARNLKFITTTTAFNALKPSIETINQIKKFPNLLAYYLYDEPDVWEYKNKAIPDVMRRVGSMAMPIEDMQQAYRKEDPLHPLMLNVDNTFKPDNWNIYGELADIFGTDPYALHIKTKETLAYVSNAAETARAACAPRPLFIWLDAYAAHTNDRFATSEEERIMAYYAIAGGAKGIFYFMYSSDKAWRGFQADKELAREIERINVELRVAGPLLAIGHQARNIASSTEVKLQTTTLFCGEKHLGVVLINRDYAYEENRKFLINPKKNVKVKIAVPEWFKEKDVLEVSPEGIIPVPWQRNGKKITAEISSIAAAKMIFITQDPDFYRQRFNEVIGK
ncbi:MAG: hypothetical protein PHV34_13675 [Verrucomicrobiae bacterium]|nr:hypothetical protein [Verrucomicrobiae bacterium]